MHAKPRFLFVEEREEREASREQEDDFFLVRFPGYCYCVHNFPLTYST